MTEKTWIWVETTSGLSCIDAGSVIGISELRGGSFLDFHMTSGTIFTIELHNAAELLDAMGVETEV